MFVIELLMINLLQLNIKIQALNNICNCLKNIRINKSLYNKIMKYLLKYINFNKIYLYNYKRNQLILY
jgi:hypothetical protein